MSRKIYLRKARIVADNRKEEDRYRKVLGHWDWLEDVGGGARKLAIGILDCGVYCGVKPTAMETIQVVLDRKLLEAADRAARRTKQNRSALIRDALREHLRTLEVRALEQRDRDGYSKDAQTDDSVLWEREAAWPVE